ncbi:MAG: lipopolysaccharide heptosyltransferase II [bacterium]
MRNLPQVKKSVKALSTVLGLCGQGCALLSPAARLRHVPELIPLDQVHRVLVIQLFALGDVLLSLPLIKGLRSVCPQGEIDVWLARNLQHEFKTLLPYVDRTIAADSCSIARTLSTVRDLRKKRYDVAFVLYPVLIGSWLARVTGARYRVGYTHDFDYRESLGGAESFLLTHPVKLGPAVIHDTQRYLALGRCLGLSLTQSPPFLYPPSSMNSYTHHFFLQQGFDGKRPLIGINPNASWKGKQWPALQFAQLADSLIQNQNVQVVFFGSKPEKEYVEGIIRSMKNKPLCAAGQTTLTQMAALISRCHLFISNDSGPMHMACALDVPTLAVMGPTRTEMFRPWASTFRIVQNPLPCTPCKDENTDQCSHFSCIRSICVDAVYDAAVEMMRSSLS